MSARERTHRRCRPYTALSARRAPRLLRRGKDIATGAHRRRAPHVGGKRLMPDRSVGPAHAGRGSRCGTNDGMAVVVPRVGRQMQNPTLHAADRSVASGWPIITPCTHT